MIYLLHFAVTWFLIGLSWFVLGVHYPLFEEVPKEAFSQYSHLHQKKATYVVLFPIFFEALSGILILFTCTTSPIFIASLILLAFVWLLTFFAVRTHFQLEKRKTQKLIDSLLHIHLLRTLSWSARGGLLLFLFQS